jgi:hypothetical protein
LRAQSGKLSARATKSLRRSNIAAIACARSLAFLDDDRLWISNQRKGLKALHTLSAYATHARLTLAQLSVLEKTNEITAIPDLLDQLAETKQLEGALVTIDAMGCQVEIADKIVAHKADYLLPLKGNQPTLESRCRGLFPHRARQ